MKIRRYKSGEEAELWRLCHDTTRRINGRDYTVEQVEKWAPRDTDMATWAARVREKNPFVAVRDESILGFAELEDDGRISAFYSHHQWQRRGVGRALFQALQAEAVALSLGVLRVEASTSAQPFFQSMGFEVVDVHEFQDCGAGVRNFIMIKRIEAPAG